MLELGGWVEGGGVGLVARARSQQRQYKIPA